MKRIFRTCGVMILMLACFIKTNAQVDPHFTQYYMYPSWLNPALTGSFDGDYRATGIYRQQWANVTTPFSTPGASIDFTTNKNINYGVSVMKQTAGEGGYSYTTAYANIAYTGLRFGVQGNQRMVFGMQLGMIDRRFNPTKMTWSSQWSSQTGYDPNGQKEVLARNSATDFDAGFGMLFFDAEPGKKTNVYVGGSVSHLTTPSDKFFASNSDAKLPVRYTLHGGLRIKLNENLTLTPNVLYLSQGNADEKMIGGYVQMKVNPTSDFLAGLNWRVNDAFAPYLGYNYKNITLGVSYDINTSDLSKIAKGSNAFEISVSFIGRKTAKTPEVEFICPRL